MLVTGVSLLASEESLAVLVKSEVGDHAVGRVDGNLSLLTVHLLFDEFLNVNSPSATVNFSDFALTSLVGSAHDLDGVSVSHGDAAGLVLGGQFLAEVSGHHSPTRGGGGGEVSLSGLSWLLGHAYRERIKG